MHSVQEVFTDSKRRISVQGWFHSDAQPLRADGATIAHLTRDAKLAAVPALTASTTSVRLSDWINAAYLGETACDSVGRAMASNRNSVSLKAFFAPHRVPATLASGCDSADGLGLWAVPRYEAGAHQGWSIRGPPHLQRCCVFEPGQSGTDSRTKAAQMGAAMVALRDVLCSGEFVSWLERVCGVSVLSVVATARRLRPGLDYTVAQLNHQRRLCVNWCWVQVMPCALVLSERVVCAPPRGLTCIQNAECRRVGIGQCGWLSGLHRRRSGWRGGAKGGGSLS